MSTGFTHESSFRDVKYIRSQSTSAVATMVTNLAQEPNSNTVSHLSGDALHAALAYAQWFKIQSLRHGKKMEINGKSLKTSSIVAIARQVIGG